MFFPDPFLPVPVQIRHDPGGPTISPLNQAKLSHHLSDFWKWTAIKNLISKRQYEILSYDMYCPSIKSNIKDRVCNHFGIYYLSIASVKRHKAGDGCESDSKVVEEIELEEFKTMKKLRRTRSLFKKMETRSLIS